ncbi:unnamed protein product [Protopolystoma xenopodis]|uniref:Uncharacterized protein n=1 Tax=Protopolystoma xenopodis TaxID=117903 RepID=A0A3S5CNR8_9PLAT|nr:unnamed protein product [Protopolystoma xenopodis]
MQEVLTSSLMTEVFIFSLQAFYEAAFLFTWLPSTRRTCTLNYGQASGGYRSHGQHYQAQPAQSQQHQQAISSAGHPGHLGQSTASGGVSGRRSTAVVGLTGASPSSGLRPGAGVGLGLDGPPNSRASIVGPATSGVATDIRGPGGTARLAGQEGGRR